jgi:ABC-type sulfate/molybdate transport systems ATPase subunit
LKDLARRYPNQLSGGEARRVALARALAARPQRLLLDEPLTHIDPALKERLLTLIKDQTQEMGATLMYITHDEREAEDVGGRLHRMENGRVVG